MTEHTPRRGYGVFEWINRRAWPLAAVVLGVTIVLALITPAVADDTEPSFDPSGEIYDTDERVVDLFTASSSIRTAAFIVDAPNGGDVLTRRALLELKQHQDAVLADADSQVHLASVFDRDLGVTMDGVY